MKFGIAFALFLVTFLVHANSPIIVSTDSMWSIYVAKSVITDGDVFLDEYRAQAKAKGLYGLRGPHGHLISYFPIGSALIAVPFVWLFDQAPEFFCRVTPGFSRADCDAARGPPTVERLHLPLERAIASFLIAVTTAALFFLLLRQTTLAYAAILALLFAFSTSAWSIASRGLWQHGPAMMLITFGLLLLGAKRSDIRGLAGLVFGAAYIVRLMSSLALGIFALYLAWVDRRAFAVYLVAAALVLVPFFALNFSFHHRILPPYYHGSRLGAGWYLPEALAANLVSASRGLFVFTPLLLLVPLTFYRRAKEHRLSKLQYAAALLITAHWLAVSSFYQWWGGHTFGPRYMSDTLPLFFFLLATPFAEAWGAKRPAKRVLIVAAAVFAIYVHHRGATATRPYTWNLDPVNVDAQPSRVWNFAHAQFLL